MFGASRRKPHYTPEQLEVTFERNQIMASRMRTLTTHGSSEVPTPFIKGEGLMLRGQCTSFYELGQTRVHLEAAQGEHSRAAQSRASLTAACHSARLSQMPLSRCQKKWEILKPWGPSIIDSKKSLYFQPNTICGSSLLPFLC